MKKFLLFVLIVALFVAGLYWWKNSSRPAPAPKNFTPARNTLMDGGEQGGLIARDREMTNLVESVVPSVVSITTTSRHAHSALPENLEQFFGQRPSEQPRIGSGVIVSKEGHILTNNHIIANMDDIKVQLDDGRTLPAKIIGTDERSDIAVLKIDAPDLKPLRLGDSDKVKVGQLVFAIGNPFGLDESVSMGIISAKGRRAADDSGREFFQTDTAINPGNSGGPLVNVHGEIIGINSSIYSGSSGGWQGIGFAIPSNTANRVLRSLIKFGRVIRGYFGVSIEQLTPELARQFGMTGTNGALVVQVAPGSPAEKAGLQRGDIITKFGSLVVSDIQEFRNHVADSPIGSKFNMTVVRDNREIPLTIEIAEQPGGADAAVAPTPEAPRQHVFSSIFSGINVSDIPANHRPFMPENVNGVMITAVDPASPAAHALQPGDVIEEINRQPITSVAEYEHLARTLNPADKQMLFISRGKTRLFVVISPE